MSNTFPFAAIVGQEDMKLAIIMSAIDPKIGGVLVFGDRGTGKSTAVRGLANLLPPINSVDGCPINSSSLDETPTWSENTSKKIVKIPMPVVDLPLGIGADRVTGALDIEKALVEGVKSFQPGLLAKANRGYLYIDEVNLLEDHIVDLLLDVSQSGENVIEREGLSIRHASNFILIGSGNPEEGELRPQLLDRFGLSVEVLTPQTIKERIEVIKRRDLFDQGPEEFQNNWKKEDKKICSKIVAAKKNINKIKTSESILELCAEICIQLGSDGLRGELTLLRASRALAAYRNSKEVSEAHVKNVATMCLSHRLRRDPLDETGSASRVERVLHAVCG
ncbi:MAG: magnesium chelatase ATPase subunit I [Rhodobacteraceae bacterium]|nr:MAG: magnesium chelatase ATPase subunit I [Paracoccaceae bacterium]